MRFSGVAATRTKTKADITDRVYDGLGGLSKNESAEIVPLVFETIMATLDRGENIKLTGFGNFFLRTKTRRVGRNPQTGTRSRLHLD